MHIIKSVKSLQQFIDSQGLSVGFVPTMGALHEGHISLIAKSKEENKLTVCSIFVNPTQFNDPNDFEKYPITIEADIEKLLAAQTDILFLPSVLEMYPDGINEVRQYNIGFLNTILDGPNRPGHFNGVCLIVHKLLLAVKPTKMYLGEKDFQQCLVLKQLVKQEGMPTEVVTCPTLREENGLAMSSRNQRLSRHGKEEASMIYTCMKTVRDNQHQKSFDNIKKECETKLNDNGFKVEYFQLANADTLENMISFDHSVKMVILVACYFEGVRLIDNLRIN